MQCSAYIDMPVQASMHDIYKLVHIACLTKIPNSLAPI